jgi:hypothetical protein
MGTNYYWRRNDRYDEKHIGKSSGGWEFNFQGYRNAVYTGNPKDDLVSWADWKSRVSETGLIIDEYGTVIPLEEFINLVENVKAPGCLWGKGEHARPLLNHVDEILKDDRYRFDWPSYRDPSRHWKDSLGYAFGTGEFS